MIHNAIVLIIAGFLPVFAHAEAVLPLAGGEVFVTDFSKKVELGWGDKKTWSDFAKHELKWSRIDDKAELFSNPATGNVVFVDINTYHNYQLRDGDTKHGETVALTTTRESKSLEPGVTWKAEHSYKTYPASWCNDNQSRIDSKFEIGPQEPYSLIVHGKQITIEVTPVVETGWWNRCYSGRRYTRHLVSKDLGAIVSIEHVGYTPQGQPHSSSYRMNVSEIKKP